MATFAYPDPHCKQVGILCDTLLSSHKLKLKKLTKGALTKDVLSELNDFRKENDISDSLLAKMRFGNPLLRLVSVM